MEVIMKKIMVLAAAMFLLVPSMVFAGESCVPKTGQTTCYDKSGTEIPCAGTGQDGDLQEGITWPDPRFTDNGDGTVTDNLTGLVWLKDANCFGTRTWANALTVCNSLAGGQCDLTDSSVLGDWRLPNRKELGSLLDLGNYYPALPTGHPFNNVQSSNYWSSTTNARYTYFGWDVRFNDGSEAYDRKGNHYYYVWPIRDPVKRK
jgi:hypothetical protein